MKEEIKNLLKKAVRELQKKGDLPEFNISEILVERSEETRHGDYSSNIALALAKKAGKSPLEIAGAVVTILKSQNVSFLKSIERVGGFINFFISDDVFVDSLKRVNGDFGKGKDLKGKKVIIDYTDPNPFKEFHIGHLMSNAIGESLSRIFEFQGARVKRVCYQGDVGIHVAKAIWGIENFLNHPALPKERDSSSEKMKFLSMAYAYGAKMYEENEEAKKQIIGLNKKIFEKSDKKINKLYDKGKKWSLEHFNGIYKKLGTKFDYFIFESEVSPLGKKIVEDGLERGIFEKSEGAVVFKGEKYGLHTRVFINSEGLPTYGAKDLGLAEIKYKKYAYDKSVIVTGNEVNDYFKVMLCAMDKVAPEFAEKTKHIGHGMLRLPEGKMSSRTGKVIAGESLIEKLEELVGQKIKSRNLSEKEKKEIAQSVAIGAIKYSILKQSIGSDIIYDFDKSISFEGDSGPYLQYSYARAESVLKKAKKEKIKPSFAKVPGEITQLEKSMSYFPDIVLQAGKSYEPHYLVLYLTGLSGIFNSYYEKNRIVDKSDEFSPYKVAITDVFSTIMENGMWLLGINLLKKM